MAQKKTDVLVKSYNSFGVTFVKDCRPIRLLILPSDVICVLLVNLLQGLRERIVSILQALSCDLVTQQNLLLSKTTHAQSNT